MKKISLLILIAFSMVSVNAQTKKIIKLSKASKKEAVAKAKFTKAEAQKKTMRDSLMVSMLKEDSLRIAADNLADLQKDSMSLSYRENGLKNIDSLKNIRYSSIIKNREVADKQTAMQLGINKAAKLNDYQSKQVGYINQTYSEKAKLILMGNDAQKNNAELIALNEERKSKLKTIVGKSRVRKIERERKEFVKNNTADDTTAWIDIAESLAKK